MAQVIIEHPDGRRYEVSEKAYEDLYAPFGFSVQGVVHNGAMLPATEENLAKANENPYANPNETELTRENAARAVILSDLEAEARARLSAEGPVTSPNAETPELINPNDAGGSATATADGSAKASGKAAKETGKAGES